MIHGSQRYRSFILQCREKRKDESSKGNHFCKLDVCAPGTRSWGQCLSHCAYADLFLCAQEQITR